MPRKTNSPALRQSGLMKLHLLQQAISDPEVQITRRAVDNNWFYENITSASVTGFNPYSGKIFIASESSLSSWIRAGMRNDRVHNEGDFLAREAMFLVHDYLHIWAVKVIQEEMPKLGFGHAPIHEKTFETHAFCHLLTETVATVGADYWYLSCIDLSEETDLGTNLDQLTVRYSEQDLPEFRRFNPELEVQTPEFFRVCAEFYCTGEFPGFDSISLKKSAKIFRWLQHELSYGEKQREYTRGWLSYLSGRPGTLTPQQLKAPLEVDSSWKRQLIARVGKRLWDKVKKPGLEARSPRIRVKPWTGPKQSPLDFRFTNLHALTTTESQFESVNAAIPMNFDFYYSQFVSSFVMDSFPMDLMTLLNSVREKKNLKGLRALFKHSGAKRLRKDPKAEIRDIFFLN